MIELTACPECGQPAEVLWREVLASTDGPIEHARVLCIREHGFFLPADRLPAPAAAVDEAPPVRQQESVRVRRNRP